MTTRLLSSPRGSAILVLAAFGLFVGASTGVAQSPDEVTRIEKATPSKAPAKPAKPRKVLIYNLTRGYPHSSIPYVDKALHFMGSKTGAYQADSTTDPKAFTRQNLAQYDAVILNNTTGEVFDTSESQEALLDFVKGGKGIVGIHAATDCCYKWPEFGEMMGGYFDGHPWVPADLTSIKLDEPSHPLVKAFDGKGFQVHDEIYQMKDPYSRKKLRVLLSLDNPKTDLTKKGVKRADKDFAVSWVQKYGKGRVFYCSLGHNHEILWTAPVLAHYLAGIQYAVGDLKAADAPNPQALQQLAMGAFQSALEQLSAYKEGGSREGQIALGKILREQTTNTAVLSRMIAGLASFAAQKDTKLTGTVEARQFALQELGSCGLPAAVPVLSSLLKANDIRIADEARKALEQIPGNEASSALRQALAATTGTVQIGVINTIGKRRDAAALTALAGIAGRTQRTKEALALGLASFATDATTTKEGTISGPAAPAQAAIIAIGRIGTPESVAVLKKVSAQQSPLAPFAQQALVTCAAQLMADGHKAAAADLYKYLKANARTSNIASAAISGLIACSPDPTALALESIASAEPGVAPAALTALMRSSDPKLLDSIGKIIDKQTTSVQVDLLNVAAKTSTPRDLPWLKAQLDSPDASVRIAALATLGNLGDGSSVGRILAMAASKPGEEQKAAREALSQLPDRSANAALIDVLTKATDKQAMPEAARALLARHANEATPALLKTAVSDIKPAQVESLNALADLAKGSDVPALVDVLLQVKEDAVRTKAEKALTSAAGRIQDESKRADDIVAAVSKAKDTESSAALLRVAGAIGTTHALDLLRSALPDSQPEIQDAAMRAVAEFPNNMAMNDALQIAKSAERKAHRILALRGFVRMLGMKSDRDASETIALSREAFALATEPEDKRTVLGELAGTELPEVFELIVPSLDDTNTSSEAAVAVLKLAQSTVDEAPVQTSQALERLLQVTTDEEQRKKANGLLKNIASQVGEIMTWQVSGPYPAASSGTTPLSQAFAPEKAGEPAAWKKASAGKKGEKRGMVNLETATATKGAKDCAAYMRVRVFSPDDRKTKLELGSDDGVVVWLNGAELLRNDAHRPCRPASDTVEASLNKGWNYLMLKVSQKAGQWDAMARFVSPDGKEMPDVLTETTECADTSKFVTAH